MPESALHHAQVQAACKWIGNCDDLYDPMCTAKEGQSCVCIEHLVASVCAILLR